MRSYFRASPPAVHQMVSTLETRRLKDRSLRLLIPREELPDLV
jgi:hypothetical protein